MTATTLVNGACMLADLSDDDQIVCVNQCSVTNVHVVGLDAPTQGHGWALTPDQADELSLMLQTAARKCREMDGRKA